MIIEHSSYNSHQVFTYITSPVIDGDAAVLQCFHFWFQIDGFLDGSKNESVKVVQQSVGEAPENLLWSLMSSTTDSGRWIEVRKTLTLDFPSFCLRARWRYVEFSKLMGRTWAGRFTCLSLSRGTSKPGWLWMTSGTLGSFMGRAYKLQYHSFRRGEDICETLPAGAGPTPHTPTTTTV